MNGLTGTMAKGGEASKTFPIGNLHVPHDLSAYSGRDQGREKLTIKAPRESDSGLFSN
jgi:hypothetical protein